MNINSSNFYGKQTTSKKSNLENSLKKLRTKIDPNLDHESNVLTSKTINIEHTENSNRVQLATINCHENTDETMTRGYATNALSGIIKLSIHSLKLFQSFVFLYLICF